jgi:anti-anti-sigma regulatory factor
MSSQPNAHIAYELIDRPCAVIVEFLTHAIADPAHAAELGQQLGALVRPELPKSYLLDFHKVRSFSSTAFGALVSFVLKVRKAGGQVLICNMDEFIRFGADLIRLGDYAPISADRQEALDQLARDQSGPQAGTKP